MYPNWNDKMAQFFATGFCNPCPFNYSLLHNSTGCHINWTVYSHFFNPYLFNDIAATEVSVRTFYIYFVSIVGKLTVRLELKPMIVQRFKDNRELSRRLNLNFIHKMISWLNLNFIHKMIFWFIFEYPTKKNNFKQNRIIKSLNPQQNCTVAIKQKQACRLLRNNPFPLKSLLTSQSSRI